jgi:hypothetical protein
MWWSRKPREVSDQDAELRALAEAYAAMHNQNQPSTSTNVKPPQSIPPESQASTSSLLDTPEIPQDEIIRGSSINYTRAEAELYAKEEPCDSWRHFDVPLSIPF